MSGYDNGRRIDDFLSCVQTMCRRIGLWSIHNQELDENIRRMTMALFEGKDPSIVTTKLMTVGAIIAQMHKSSMKRVEKQGDRTVLVAVGNREARMVACEAFVQLYTFAMSNFWCNLVGDKRRGAILKQDAIDRGFKVRRPTTSVQASASV